MKAIFRFKDGENRISQVPSSETAAGETFILERVSVLNSAGEKVEMIYQSIRIVNEDAIAEYLEASAERAPLSLVKSG